MPLKNYFRSYDFRRGLLLASTILTCGLILYSLNLGDLIPGVAIGILLTSFCDIQGDFEKRILAMLFSILLNVVSFLIINSLLPIPFLLILYLTLSVFMISYLGVFGFRANMFALSGLMGIVLSMVRHYDHGDQWQHAYLIVIGGLVYMLFSSLFHIITKKSQVNEKLSDLMDLIISYLKLKLDSYENNTPIDQKTRLAIHQQITENQEDLRNLLFANEIFGGASKTRNRQMLLLVELIDISELGNTSPVDIIALRKSTNWRERLFIPYIDVLKLQIKWLEGLSVSLRGDASDIEPRVSIEDINDLSKPIDEFAIKYGITKVRDVSIPLLNFQKSLTIQQTKLNTVYYLIKNKKNRQFKSLAQSYQTKFKSGEDYSIKGLKDSFKLSSPHLRHSIRLTVSIILGYIIGIILNVNNPYWIMLTIVVIMRPSYGLTKERSVQRVLGTIVGVLIAAGILLITTYVYAYVVIALVSMVFGFSLINRNYFLAAIAITLNVIFAFILILPEPWTVIQFRLIDTVIGSGVSVLVGYTVLPHWEYKTIRNSMIEVLQKNQDYIEIIIAFYKNPKDDLEYRLTRKMAFSSTGELHAAFQRYTQDPKRKQLKREYYYEWMTINQNILAALANLGTYIREHHNADIKESFEHTLRGLMQDLNQVEAKLTNSEVKEINGTLYLSYIDDYYKSLLTARDKEIEDGQLEMDQALRSQLLETKHIKQEINILKELIDKLHLVTDQLI